MKILLMIPPHVPSYFNAGHHLPVFQTAAFLRLHHDDWYVRSWDGAALNAGWREVCKLLVEGWDAIGLLNDFDGVDTFPRMLTYVAELCPGARVFTFGRLSKQIPRWFRQFPLDAIVESGDYEAGVASYLDLLAGGDGEVPGVWVRDRGVDPSAGAVLPCEAWVFPNVEEIPYAEYRRMYDNDLNKYCGIPKCLELVVPVARGCPIGCTYCDVPSMQGLRERRVSVMETLRYIAEAHALRAFDYVSFYAPTFTLRRQWVLDLCETIVSRGPPFRWKCVTTLAHLDQFLLERMAAAGCVRVSVGLETMDDKAAFALPAIKRGVESAFDEVAAVCESVGIELNCFVIFGLPGDSIEGIRHTVRRVLSKGARVRPTVYTSYQEMHDEMTLLDVSRFNRQLFAGSVMSPEMAAVYYRLLYANDNDRPTLLSEVVPAAARVS